MKCINIILLIVLLLLNIIYNTARNEIEVYWGFDIDNEFDGWAQDTPNQMKIDCTIVNGELRGIIKGEDIGSLYKSSPYIESPSLSLSINKQHYIIIRMNYNGKASKGNVLLKSGYSLGTTNSNHNEVVWTDSITPKAILDSGSLDGYNSSFTTDNNKYSYYLSNRNRGSYIIYDLGSYKHITMLKILSIGGSNSPKRCLLQKSLTSGVGPFTTVHSFTLSDSNYQYNQFYNNRNNNNNESFDSLLFDELNDNNSSTSSHPLDISEQIITGFSDQSRYWKIIFIDNYGGDSIGIREVSFDGYNDYITSIPFTINNDGYYHNYYIPLYPYLYGNLLKFRLLLDYSSNQLPTGKFFRELIDIDYVSIARAPVINQVTGCIDLFYEKNTNIGINVNTYSGAYSVISYVNMINNVLPLYYYNQDVYYITSNISYNYYKSTNSSDSYTFTDVPNYSYASTYDCPRNGGTYINITGDDFGIKSTVFIDNILCPIVNRTLISIICLLPAYNQSSIITTKLVKVVNNAFPTGLYTEVPYLAYRTAPLSPSMPLIRNLAAYKVDLSWNPPENKYSALTITGYEIIWFQPKYPSRVSNTTVGNVTLTSIRGLQPATEYVFAVAAISEGTYPINRANLPTDLYGRRSVFSSDYQIGEFSQYTEITATLPYDFNFDLFNANKTLNVSSGDVSIPSGIDISTNGININGPTGIYGSEGHYGLVLVGSANIENCNVSSTCCDNYNATIGLSSCSSGYKSVCAVFAEASLPFDYVINDITRFEIPSNIPFNLSNGLTKLQPINIITLEELYSYKGALLPTISCGPSLRLTPSEARMSGSAWYKRKVNVLEGFDTTITYQISNPSQRCDNLDDVNTYCRSRGADGWAFVIQNVSPLALGLAGSGLGYSGIDNALAVEIDTYHNYDLFDFYENHISVMTQGFRYNITSNHSRSLATSTKVPDLTDGIHTVRIKYDPVFDETAVPHPSFQSNGYTSSFVENADFPYGGEGDWGTGFGLLYVYIDDLYSPVITTPLNLDATLILDNGRSYVGLTAATGDNHWQTHDIISWKFNSLYRDISYTAPTKVNGIGDYRCVNDTVCVHRVDYDHYMRTDNIWGPGYDSTEGWQSGNEGFCQFC